MLLVEDVTDMLFQRMKFFELLEAVRIRQTDYARDHLELIPTLAVM